MAEQGADPITTDDVRWGWRESGGHEQYRAHTFTRATLEKGPRMLGFGYRVNGHEYSDSAEIERHLDHTRWAAEQLGFDLEGLHPETLPRMNRRIHAGPLFSQPSDAWDEIDACVVRGTVPGCEAGDEARRIEKLAVPIASAALKRRERQRQATAGQQAVARPSETARPKAPTLREIKRRASL